MPAIDIILDGDNAWPDLAHKQIISVTDDAWHLAAVPEGMASGAPSLALRLDLDSDQIDADDVVVVAQTSLAVWITATCALRGRFPEAFAGGPLETLRAADEPELGLSSTRELLKELVARLLNKPTPMDVPETRLLNTGLVALDHLSAETLDYRTVDGG